MNGAKWVMAGLVMGAWSLCALACTADGVPSSTDESTTELATAALGASDAPTITIVAPTNFTDFAYTDPGVDVGLV
ncbi:MAG: hypothetical protein QF464_21430, partial [Myxococcota bacterium]|nr:hypothetical protein [Myxococcota bacterium]